MYAGWRVLTHRMSLHRRCGLAPVLTVNEDVYGRLVPEDVDKILAKYTA